MMQLRTFTPKFLVLLASLMLAATAGVAAADTISLTWDPNPETEVTGYIVHVGTQSGVYTQHVDVGLQTSYAFPTAVAGQQYCFAVSAYVAGPVEGPRSNEICGFSNRPPTLANPGALTGQVSQATTLQLQGIDPDGQAVTYSGTGLPTGMTLQPSTGFISGTPTAAGSFTATATVSDGVLTASQSFTWTIGASDVTAPSVTITGPTSATTYTTTASTVTLSGTAADNVAVTQATWVNNRGGSGTAAGTTGWSAANIALQSGSNILTVTARDAAGNTSSDVLTVTYNVADTTAPAVTITGPTSAATYSTTGTTVALSGTASDNVGVVQVTWVNNRGGSGTATGTTSWTVSSVALQTGANVLTVTGRDAAGNNANDVLTVNVNGAPTLTNPGSPSSPVALSTSLQLSAIDPNGDTLTYSATGLPAGFSLTASNGLIAGTPLLTGSYPVTATVSDGALSASQSFTWTIAPNASATGTIRLMWDANTESGLAGYIVHAGIVSGAYLQHHDVGLTTTYVFANAVQGQRYCFTVSAYMAGPTEGPRSAEVCGYANAAPTLASVINQSSNAGQAATLQLAGSDPEGSALTYSATGLPAGLSVAPSTGLISGTPTTAGTYSGTAMVSDGSLTASRSFTWTVVAVDTTAPVVMITGPTSAATFTTASSTVTVNGTASDSVGVTQVTWANNRGGNGSATGTTTWSTGAIALQSGVNVLTITARDGAGNSATAVLTVTRNAAPTLASIADRSHEVGTLASLQLVGNDVDGDLLTYGAYGLPPGVALVVSTGLLSGTPTEPGVYSVTATVLDGVQSASRTFTWTITADVTAPALAIAAPTTAAAYSTSVANVMLSGTASDSIGVAQVSWVNNRGGSGVATGTTSWTVSGIALQSGANLITVTARDGAGNSTSATLTVTFNSAPALSSVSNQTTAIGTAAALQLTASDPDADALVFTATGLPSDLTIGTGSGFISGTASGAGTFSVVVTVSDGMQSTSQAFTWSVTSDVTVPSLSISGPTANATYTSATASLTVTGAAADNLGVAQVTWSNDRGGSGTASGTTNWSIAGIALQSGVNVITVAARDAAGNVATDVIAVTFTVNAAPTLAAVSNQSTRAGLWDTLQLVGGDANGDVLTYSATGLPPGLSINAATGQISGIPTTVGVHTVTAQVFDGQASRSRTFTWTIKKRFGFS